MATKTSKTSKSTKSRKTKKQTNKKPKLRREIWGGIYVLSAIIIALSLFGFEGVFLAWIKMFFGALIGSGIYVLPVSLIFIGYLLIFRAKSALRLRLFGGWAFPVLIGSFIHCISSVDVLVLNPIELAKSGSVIKSGGIISGLLGSFMAKGFSGVGALIILSILIFISIFLSIDLTLKDVYELIFGYDDGDEKYIETEKKIKEERLEIIKAKATEQKIEKELFRQYSKPNIDINLSEPKQNKQKPSYTVTDFNPDEFETSYTDASVSFFDSQKPLNSLKIEQTPEEPQIIPQAVDASITLSEEETDEYSDVDDIDLFVRAAKKVQPRLKKDVQINAKASEIIEKSSDIIEETEEIAETEEPIENALENNLKLRDIAYDYPHLDLLNKGVSTAFDASYELRESSERLIDTLKSFNVDAQIINIIRGPSVTRFEMQISRGTKFSKVTSLSDDIALSLGAVSVRIAPIPDKLAIGIEVPNKTVQMVYIREVLASKEFTNPESRLSFSVGKDITGAAIVGDIAKMPHMLIAGTTGSGKSVCINSILISILYKATPDEVRLIMIDPKMIELGSYNGIPHLLIPVVTDPKKAAGALNWAVGEMMKRYKLFSEEGVRDLASYNAIMRKRIENGEEATVQPQIVIVIDELADLMMVAAREVEEAICRIAQMARAAGMHLIIATQRPSADVITGIMKANIPSRIAFAVASQIESRIILDQTGAEKLIGKGDMLYFPLGLSKPTRVQGCFLTSDEVNRAVEHVKSLGQAEYSDDIIEHIERQVENSSGAGSSVSASDGSCDEDEMLGAAIDIAVEAGQISVSLLQRKLKLGYARAARLVDEMEERGIVGAFEGSKPRQVLISKQDWQEINLRKMD